nr:right-handed parallel beta-helix repeat-containing protein [Desulfuromonadales bacterium]
MRALLVLTILLLPVCSSALVLSADAVWQGAMTISEAVRVEPGAVLTVRPGSRIRFDGGRLEVAGTLRAEDAVFTGDDWSGIVLKGVDEKTVLRRCRIEGARTGIFVGGGAPRLVGLQVAGNRIGIELKQQARPLIEDSLFRGNSRVGLFVKGESQPRVTGNDFEANGRYGAYIYRAAPAGFTGNRFVRNKTGLAITHFGSNPRIDGNLFLDNEQGILVDKAAQPLLSGNRITGNRVGVRFHRRSDPQMRGNLVKSNGTGALITYSSYPQIEGNDFVGNDRALVLEFQSSRWEERKGRAARAEAVSARGAFGGKAQRSVTEADRRADALDGTVEAGNNWWGEDGTRELARVGAGGNPSFIADGRDTPQFEEDGRSYPMDRVRFAPWSRDPLTGFAAKHEKD